MIVKSCAKIGMNAQPNIQILNKLYRRATNPLYSRSRKQDLSRASHLLFESSPE